MLNSILGIWDSFLSFNSQIQTSEIHIQLQQMEKGFFNSYVPMVKENKSLAFQANYPKLGKISQRILIS